MSVIEDDHPNEEGYLLEWAGWRAVDKLEEQAMGRIQLSSSLRLRLSTTNRVIEALEGRNHIFKDKHGLYHVNQKQFEEELRKAETS